MTATTKPNALERIFGVTRPIIGTIHLLPLPGAPAYDGQDMTGIVERAVTDATAYARGGLDGVIVENEGDIPFLKPDSIGPETVAALTAATAAVRAAVSLPVGSMCLANAALESLAVAKATGASFIRANGWANAYIANEGYIEGAAARALRYRSMIHARDVAVFADVHVKHASHAIVADRPLAEQARDVEAFGADVLIASGSRTGDPVGKDELECIARAVSSPVIIGSGLDEENVADLLPAADGAIVGSSLKSGGVWWNPVDEERVRALMSKVESVRR
jgi:membrane complex biogenesis BtpA family protein